jgi:hypothetical protein
MSSNVIGMVPANPRGGVGAVTAKTRRVYSRVRARRHPSSHVLMAYFIGKPGAPGHDDYCSPAMGINYVSHKRLQLS